MPSSSRKRKASDSNTTNDNTTNDNNNNNNSSASPPMAQGPSKKQKLAESRAKAFAYTQELERIKRERLASSSTAAAAAATSTGEAAAYAPYNPKQRVAKAKAPTPQKKKAAPSNKPTTPSSARSTRKKPATKSDGQPAPFQPVAATARAPATTTTTAATHPLEGQPAPFHMGAAASTARARRATYTSATAAAQTAPANGEPTLFSVAARNAATNTSSSSNENLTPPRRPSPPKQGFQSPYVAREGAPAPVIQQPPEIANPLGPPRYQRRVAGKTVAQAHPQQHQQPSPGTLSSDEDVVILGERFVPRQGPWQGNHEDDDDNEDDEPFVPQDEELEDDDNDDNADDGVAVPLFRRAWNFLRRRGNPNEQEEAELLLEEEVDALRQEQRQHELNYHPRRQQQEQPHQQHQQEQHQEPRLPFATQVRTFVMRFFAFAVMFLVLAPALLEVWSFHFHTIEIGDPFPFASLQFWDVEHSLSTTLWEWTLQQPGSVVTALLRSSSEKVPSLSALQKVMKKKKHATCYRDSSNLSESEMVAFRFNAEKDMQKYPCLALLEEEVDQETTVDWLQCPEDGVCVGGRLVHCKYPFFEMMHVDDDSHPHNYCAFSDTANQTIQATNAKLEAWTVEHYCRTGGNPHVVVRDMDMATPGNKLESTSSSSLSSSSPWFNYTELLEELEVEKKSLMQLLLDANRRLGPTFVVVEQEDGQVLVGLHQVPALPTMCIVKNAVAAILYTIFSVTASLLWGILMVFVDCLFASFHAAPVTTIVCLFGGIAGYWIWCKTSRQRQRAQQLDLDVSATLADVVTYLRENSTRSTKVVAIRDEIKYQWTHHQLPKRLKNRDAEKRWVAIVWPRVEKAIGRDNRVQIIKQGTGADSIYWKWDA